MNVEKLAEHLALGQQRNNLVVGLIVKLGFDERDAAVRGRPGQGRRNT